MADLDINQPSAFESFLRFVGRPGFAVRNILKGNWQGAARQLADIPLDVLDAALPGDILPEISLKEEDFPEFSDVVGGMKPGIGKIAVDIAGGIATDPLTFFGGPIISAAGKGITAGTKAVTKAAPSVGVAATSAKKFIQRTAAARPISKEFEPMITEAQNLTKISSQANTEAIKGLFSGVLPEDRKAMFAAINNVIREGGLSKAGGKASPIIGETKITAPYLGEEIAKEMAGKDPKAVARMAKNDLVEDVDEIRYDPVSKMLGGVNVNQAPKVGPRLPNTIDAVSTLEGGTIPAMERVALKDAPEVIDKWGKLDELKNVLRQRLDSMGLPAEQRARLEPLVDKVVDTTSGQFRELVEKGVFTRPQGRDLLSEGMLYAQRAYSGLDTDADLLAKLGAPQASKARVLPLGEDVADFLNKNPDITLEDDLALAMANRGQQQAGMLGRASIAKSLTEKYAKSAEDKIRKIRESQDPAHSGYTALRSQADKYKMAGLTEEEIAAYEARGMPLFKPDGTTDLASAASKIISSIRKTDPDTADALDSIYKGIAPRGALMNVIAKGNALFKPYATAGAFIPKISFNVRNVVSGLGQVLSNPAARKAWPKYAKGMANDILGAIDDGIEHLTGKRFAPNQFEEVNRAFAASGGRVDDALANIKDPMMREMVENGVITGGFVNSEQLVDTIARTGWSKKWRDMRDWPSAIAKGSEMRMRASVYKALREGGQDAQTAAKNTMDTFFDYSIAGVENRAARDVIPFFQFTAKAIPQSAKLLKEQPWVMAGVRPLFSQGEDRPVYPYMQRGVNIPLGEDEAGNQEYLTSLGLPIESLTQIPNPSGSPFDFLKDLRQGVVSQATPPLKTVFAALSGVDPFFGTQFASYDKPPAALEALGLPAGDVARTYNVAAGTGLIQPLAAPIAAASAYAKPDESWLRTATNTLTGAKIRSVDEARALQQLLEDELRTRPSVQKYTSLYDKSQDPETKALLDKLKEVKSKIKAAKKEAKQN